MTKQTDGRTAKFKSLTKNLKLPNTFKFVEKLHEYRFDNTDFWLTKCALI